MNPVIKIRILIFNFKVYKIVNFMIYNLFKFYLDEAKCLQIDHDHFIYIRRKKERNIFDRIES